jgi:hypothetical protein
VKTTTLARLGAAAAAAAAAENVSLTKISYCWNMLNV